MQIPAKDMIKNCQTIKTYVDNNINFPLADSTLEAACNEIINLITILRVYSQRADKLNHPIILNFEDTLNKYSTLSPDDMIEIA